MAFHRLAATCAASTHSCSLSHFLASLRVLIFPSLVATKYISWSTSGRRYLNRLKTYLSASAGSMSSVTVKPVGTPVAIFGSLGVCIYVLASRHWLNLLEPVRDCADPFVDDVIIASGDPSMSYEELLEAHERDVTRVLDLLVRHKLTGSSDKATIAVSKVVFAGHVVGNGQRKPIPGKVAAIEHWEKPKTVSELRAYLGFCNYYSGYIRCMPSMQPP